MSLDPGNKVQFGQIVIFGSSDFNMLGDDLVLGLIEQLVKNLVCWLICILFVIGGVTIGLSNKSGLI